MTEAIEAHLQFIRETGDDDPGAHRRRGRFRDRRMIEGQDDRTRTLTTWYGA